jgi:hypothetical protein
VRRDALGFMGMPVTVKVPSTDEQLGGIELSLVR